MRPFNQALYIKLYVYRSESIPIGSCSTSNDCYPDDLDRSSVPTKYINCSDQKCVCSDCFYATNSYKSCAYQRCWKYDNITQTCNDLRKDQRTAFLLSLFLSALGAANFYIERYDLGIWVQWKMLFNFFETIIGVGTIDKLLNLYSHAGGIQLAILVLLPFILLGIICIGLFPIIHLLENYNMNCLGKHIAATRLSTPKPF